MTFRTLVDTTTLAAHVNDPSWRIFDCRHDLADPAAGELAYRLGHIPNAQFLHLDRDLSGTKTGANGRHPLPDPAALAAKLGHSGVRNDAQVVVYDDGGGMYAARLWWLLRWLGHERVAVLDGGFTAWREAGHPTTDQTPVVAPTTLEWRLNEEPVTTTDIETQPPKRLLLLDARAPERFRGESETIDPVAGHIPGAINRPFSDNLTGDKRFKSAAILRRELEALLGNRPPQAVVAYCGSGVTACHNLLALEIAGFRGARLYAGSWSEWCSDPKRPVATNAE